MAISMRDLLNAGVHFGHQTTRWNPKMKPYIYKPHEGIYIIDLRKTIKLVRKAYDFVRDTVLSGQRVLFVGTKKQAAPIIKEEAERGGQFYVHNRWLGGTLTNFVTIKQSIERLNRIEKMVTE